MCKYTDIHMPIKIGLLCDFLNINSCQTHEEEAIYLKLNFTYAASLILKYK
jgi:hypothetical protein